MAMRHVVLIDEQPGSREALRWILRLRGHACVAVASVEAAGRELAAFEPAGIVIARLTSRVTATALRHHLGRTLVERTKDAAGHDHQPHALVIAVVDNLAQVVDHELVDLVLTRPLHVAALDAALEIARRDLG